MARLIRPDGTETWVRSRGKKFTLDEMYAHVECQTIEIIDRWVPQLGGKGKKARVRMVIDEEGKLTGKAYNRVATELVRGALMPDDFVVGNALVMEKGDSL